MPDADRSNAGRHGQPHQALSPMLPSVNVLGFPLERCDCGTGLFGDSHCNSDQDDLEAHVVCAVMTEEFLAMARTNGHEFVEARSEDNFPGLIAGDRWCISALLWLYAFDQGCAPPIVLESTHRRALKYIPVDQLADHAYKPPDTWEPKQR